MNSTRSPKIRKRGINARDRRILSKRVAGKIIRQIAEEMGTSKSRVFLILKRLEPELQEALRRAGYGLDKAVTKMAELTEAKRTVFFQNGGKVTDKRVVADNPIRFAARREMLRNAKVQRRLCPILCHTSVTNHSKWAQSSTSDQSREPRKYST